MKRGESKVFSFRSSQKRWKKFDKLCCAVRHDKPQRAINRLHSLTDSSACTWKTTGLSCWLRKRRKS